MNYPADSTPKLCQGGKGRYVDREGVPVDNCSQTGEKREPVIVFESLTFIEIDHEIIFPAILLPFADLGRVVVSYKRKCVHEVLVNCLVKLAQEKV